MLRFVAILTTLAVANCFSVYQMPDCLSPIDLNLCNQAPCPCPCPAPAGQTVCLPVSGGAPLPGCNTNAIITLLAALKNAGLITDPTAPPPRGSANDNILALKLLDLITLSLGIGGGSAPGNGTLPIGGDSAGLLPSVFTLLSNLLGGGAAPAPAPSNLQAILLNVISSLAAGTPGCGGCPCGTVPVTLPACTGPRVL